MFREWVLLHLKFRYYVVIGAVLASAYGLWTASELPIDVFPDINQPYVTVMVEAPGLAPEEVERLVVFPIESSLNGAPGVEVVRSSSGVGFGSINVSFEWGWDIYLCRQIVQERLQSAADRLPEGIVPGLAPVAAITGEIMRIGLTSDGSVSPVELRSLAEWDLRLHLLTVPGVAQIMVVGGGVKQYEALADPARLAKYGVTLAELETALEGTNVNTPGGFVLQNGQELLVRNIGRFPDVKQLEALVIKSGDHGSVLLRDVASIREGVAPPRGSAGVNAEEGVLLTILKQPGANTLELSDRIEIELNRLEKALPSGVKLWKDIYRQATFIHAAVDNVIEALRDGSLLVVLIIALFLWNLRMSFIILTAIPLAFILTGILFSWLGISINTMTLGGLAVAVGELVDSAIVGAENIYRRLRQNQELVKDNKAAFYRVIADATSEVYSAIVVGTLLVLLVVIPLFGLPGVVGRLFAPIGAAYLICIAASTFVAVGLTPVLCSLLLRGHLPDTEADTRVVQYLKRAIGPVVLFSVRFPKLVLLSGFIASSFFLVVLFRLGSDLLPQFNEGSAYIVAMSPPGTNLEESSRLGKAVETMTQKVPELATAPIGRRTGRAEGDEHVMGVGTSEIEVEIRPPVDGQVRSREEILADLRDNLGTVPGLITEVQQPLEHRISHMISGARTQVVLKIFGSELGELRRLAKEVHAAIQDVPGVVDDYVEQQAPIPQIRVEPKLEELARYGLSLSDVLDHLETALQGKHLAEVQEGERYFEFVVRAEDELRDHPELLGDLLLTSPQGAKIPLKAVAKIGQDFGPNEIPHENSRRRILVMCNIADRDLGSAVHEIEAKINEAVDFPEGYNWVVGGQYPELIRSGKAMGTLSALALVLIIAILVGQFRSPALAAIVLLNIPQALIGSVIALLVTGTTLNMGALVGFVALCGIASRNGILLITHFVTLLKEEGETFGPEMILRGCRERLTPVLMTALTTNLGLLPLLYAEGQPGKEILFPVAVVIFGGLITSTILDFTITPAASALYGRKAILRLAEHEDETE